MTLTYDENGVVKHFRKDLEGLNKEELREFLVNHPRYHTMNSWNRSTSYANCVKINRLPLTNEQANKAYDMLDSDEVYERLKWTMADWERERKYKWQVGFNGRSGGYIVLYQGGLHPDGRTFTWPGKSFDMEPAMDFDGWELEDYQDRAKFVAEFDLLCDQVLTEFIDMIETYEVKEETIYVPQTVKVLVEKEKASNGGA